MPAHQYGGREKVTAFWKQYLRHEDASQVKRTQIYLLRDYMGRMCNAGEDMGWFLSMLLERGSRFEELELGARDACVRYLLTEKGANSDVWNSLLTTDFIPRPYVDDYIENIKNSSKKYLIPLFISAKFKEREKM